MTRQELNKYILLVGEVIIPLLGYLLWNWNIYFIFLFMFLDLIAYDVLFYFKYRRIERYRKGKFKLSGKFIGIWMMLLMISIVVFIGYSFLLNTILQSDFKNEIVNFLIYEDMGFAQGYVLIPFIVLTAYLTYKTEFLLQRQYMILEEKTLIKNYLTDNIAVILLLTLLTVFYKIGFDTQGKLLTIGIMAYVCFRIYQIKPKDNAKHL